MGWREVEGMTCGGALDELATIDLRGAPCNGGIGLRLPPLEGPALVDWDGCSSDTVGGFTMLTSGGTVGATMPAVLPRLCSISACCCCFKLIMDRTCSKAFGSSPRMVKPMTTGEIPLSIDGLRTSVLIPLIVTRRFLEGLGEDEDEDGLSSSSLCLCGNGPLGSGGSTGSVSVSCLTFTIGRGDGRLQQHRKSGVRVNERSAGYANHMDVL